MEWERCSGSGKQGLSLALYRLRHPPITPFAPLGHLSRLRQARRCLLYAKAWYASATQAEYSLASPSRLPCPCRAACSSAETLP